MSPTCCVLNIREFPSYHDEDGLPRGWIDRMKRAIRMLGRHNTDRMVMDCVHEMPCRWRHVAPDAG